MRKGLPLLLAISFGSTALVGCMAWKPGWRRPPANRGAAAPVLLEDAERLAASVVDRESLERAIAAHESVLASAAEDFSALAALSHLHLLLGDAYVTAGSEKRSSFRLARSYAERAMYTNPDFRRLGEGGEPTWAACRALGAREMDAMGFWVNAVFYEYKERGMISQVLNFRWMGRAKTVLARMAEIDPQWAGGGVDFIWGIYYLAIPESVGGDREKSAARLQKAIDEGPDRLLHRWGRAKYYCVKMHDRATFVRDLEWIVAQDPGAMRDLPAWRNYFVSDAKKMLREVDRYF
jgi:hypothetical protein